MDYIEINKAAWNIKTAAHVHSEFYKQEAFLAGQNTLQSIELNLLGDVKGKSILHLQCHFGQDTLSLARMGATTVGVDFSEKAIQVAKDANETLGLNSQFVCCNIYDLPQHLKGQFDVVFTSYGTIGWLEDIKGWASIIRTFLKPGGQFVFVEFHPAVWMFSNDFSYVQYSYFHDQPIVEDNEGSYADREANITYQTVGFNHSLSEVIQALLKEGLQIHDFQEYNYSPYNCFPDMEQLDVNQFNLKRFGNKLPMVYSVVATG